MARRPRDDDDDDQTTPATPATPAAQAAYGGAAATGSRGGRRAEVATRDDDDDYVPVSLSSKDAIDVGLFASGPARIKESLFATYDYQGTTRNPPLVWLITWERGEGKLRETYEQPYTIGKGWFLDKKGRLRNKDGRVSGLPKNCNALRHLVYPLEKALETANIDLPPTGLFDPAALDGLTGIVERVNQEERNIPDANKDLRSGPSRRERTEPRTILQIAEVHSVGWTTTTTADAPRVARAAKATRASRTAAKTAPAPPPEPPDDETDADRHPLVESDLLDDAIEAILDVVERSGKAVRFGEALEQALETTLKGVKNAADIIDVAMLPKTLKLEKGWSFDGKYLDAAE